MNANTGCLDQLYLAGLGAAIVRINLHNYSDQNVFQLNELRLIFTTIRLSPLEDVVVAGAANGTVSLQPMAEGRMSCSAQHSRG